MEATKQSKNDPPEVSRVLESMNKLQQDIEAEKWITDRLIVLLKRKLNIRSAPFLSTAEYRLVGSAAEKLVVSNKDDKDILLILGEPYTYKYFESVYDFDGMHYLKWNNCYFQGSRPQFLGQYNRLLIYALRNFIHECLESLKGERIDNLHVHKLELWRQTLRVHLKQNGAKQKYTVDIIPQIKGNVWSKVKGVKPLTDLTPSLQKTITALEASGESSIMFSLFGPPGTSVFTVKANYAVLEKEFFLNNNDLRNIALLAKLILRAHNWKKRFGLKGAHLKRLLMANSERFSTLKPWEGVNELLLLVISQLGDGYMDGFPDVDCDMMWHKNAEDCHATAKAMANVMMTLDPQYFELYLSAP